MFWFLFLFHPFCSKGLSMEPRESKSRLWQLAVLPLRRPSLLLPPDHPGCSWTACSSPMAICRPEAAGPGDGGSLWGHMPQGDSHHRGACDTVLAGLPLCICPCVFWLAQPLFTIRVREGQESTTRARRAGQCLLLPFLLVRRQCEEMGRRQLDLTVTHTHPVHVLLSSLPSV